jgi:hypothetical protein
LQLPGLADELRRALGALGSRDGAAALAAASTDAPASCIAERITRALGDWTQLIGAPMRVLDAGVSYTYELLAPLLLEPLVMFILPEDRLSLVVLGAQPHGVAGRGRR